MTNLLNFPPLSVQAGPVTTQPENEVWVRADSKIRVVTATVFHRYETNQLPIDLACIGVNAVNQAVMSIMNIRRLLVERGCDILVQPWFSTVLDAGDEERTRTMFRLHMVDTETFQRLE